MFGAVSVLALRNLPSQGSLKAHDTANQLSSREGTVDAAAEKAAELPVPGGYKKFLREGMPLVSVAGELVGHALLKVQVHKRAYRNVELLRREYARGQITGLRITTVGVGNRRREGGWFGRTSGLEFVA